VPLGGDYDLLGPFPGRTASGHGLDCERLTCRAVDQLSSPGSQRMDGHTCKRGPRRACLATSLSSLLLSAAEVYPHHEGDAYRREAMGVILANSCTAAAAKEAEGHAI